MVLLKRKQKMADVSQDALLDRIPKILAAKGLSTPRSPMGSEEVRQVLLAADALYQAAQTEVEEVSVTLKFLRDKRSGLENGLHTIRAILRDDSTLGSGLDENRQ